MNSKINIAKIRHLRVVLMDLTFGVALASILALGAKCPIADSITAGLVLMIVLMLIDMREGQSQGGAR